VVIEDEFRLVLETEVMAVTEAWATFIVVVAPAEVGVDIVDPLRVTAAILLAHADAELEDEDVIMNGNEYWKVDGSESRVSLKPYVANPATEESTHQANVPSVLLIEVAIASPN